MVIAAPCVVSLSWRLEDAHGQPIDTLDEPIEFFFGGDDLLERIEQTIDGQQPGFEVGVQLEPEHAFGDYDPGLVCFEDRTLFPERTEPGMQFEGLPAGAATPDMPRDAIYTVTEVYPSHVVLDGNHPLAGIALVLALKVREVRAASEEEVKLGSVATQALTVLSTAPPSTQLH